MNDKEMWVAIRESTEEAFIEPLVIATTREDAIEACKDDAREVGPSFNAWEEDYKPLLDHKDDFPKAWSWAMTENDEKHAVYYHVDKAPVRH